MAVFRSIALIFIGISCIIGNVWAADLDLGNILRSGFPISRSHKNSCTYTEVSPNANHVLTRVLYAGEVVWEAPRGSRCIGLTLVESRNGQQPIMYIESRSGSAYSIQYYAKNGQVFFEIDNTDYNQRLSRLATFPLLDPDAVLDEEREGVSNQDGEYEDYGLDVGEPGFGGVRTSYEHTQNLVKQKKLYLRKEPDYACNPEHRDCSHEKRVLDILRPSENTRVTLDYEINDGVFAMIATIKRGKRVTLLYEGNNIIWDGLSSAKMVVLSCHAFFGEYRLAELYYKKGGDYHYMFFGKKVGSWTEMTENEFSDSYKSLKANIKTVEELRLNIGTVVNADKFFQKTEESERFKAFTYFPFPGYRVNEVLDGSIKIWGSASVRCICAIAVKEANNIRFLKLELVKGFDESSANFYKKVDDEYILITKEQFEDLINAPPGVASGEIEIGPGGNEPRKQFDIADYNPVYISKGQYNGINFKSFVPPPGKVFREVKLHDTFIWQATPDEYTDFVRIFYPNDQPKLGFLKLVTINEGEEDKYFIRDRDGWKFVSMEKFRDTFYKYTQPEPSPATPKPEPKVEPQKPEPKLEPKVEQPKPEPRDEPKPEPKVEEPKPEPKTQELKLEPKEEPKPEEPKPEPKEAPKAEPPKPEPKVEEPKPEPKPEPKAQQAKTEPKTNQPEVKQSNSKPAKNKAPRRMKRSDGLQQWIFDYNRRQQIHDHLMPFE